MTRPDDAPAWARDPWSAQARLLAGIPSPMIFDVGANVGQTLRRYLGTFPEARIQCFEPSPEAFPRLQEAAAGHPGVSVHRLALGERQGLAPLYTNPRRSAVASLLPRPTAGRRYYPADAEVIPTASVPVETLDRFCQARGIGRIDALKMDVQGGELMVLGGAHGLLEGGSIGLVYTEVMVVPHYEGGPLLHELTALLTGYGFSLYNLYHMVMARNGQLRFGDAIFVSDTLRADVLDAFPPEP